MAMLKHFGDYRLLILLAIVAICFVGEVVIKVRYISVADIILNHIKCFRRTKDGKILIMPFLEYMVFPCVLGAVLSTFKKVDSNMINMITIVVSVLTAMLFSLLSVIIDMNGKVKNDPQYYSLEAEVSKRSLRETYYTVMFEILIAVILLICCFVNTFLDLFSTIQSAIIYALTFLMVVNLLMILKRIFRVIDTDMKK